MCSRGSCVARAEAPPHHNHHLNCCLNQPARRLHPYSIDSPTIRYVSPDEPQCCSAYAGPYMCDACYNNGTGKLKKLFSNCIGCSHLHLFTHPPMPWILPRFFDTGLLYTPPASGSKLWGFTIVLIKWEFLINTGARYDKCRSARARCQNV